MRKLLVTLTIAALATAFAACGGDDDDSTAATTTDETADDSTDSTDAPDETDAPDNGDDFSALLQRSKEASYRVTYTNAAEGNEDFTISQDPPNSALIIGDERYVTNADGTFACDASQCQELPGAAASAVTSMVTGFFGAFSALVGIDEATGGTFAYDVDVTDDEEIAGRDARCAEITGEGFTGGASAKACVDAELGILLLAESGGADRIEATEVGDPESSDFEASTS
jgi:hypothetical protein